MSRPGTKCDLTCEHGHIAWRWGTGDNVELTHLKATEPGRGKGREMLRTMLAELRENPPYHTVFGFTRACNVEAQEFYRAMGFELSLVVGVYKDGEAVVFSAVYEDLCKRHGV